MQGISNPIKDVYIVKADSADTIMHTGDGNETTLKSFIIPGGSIGANGSVRIKATGVSRGNGGIKTYRLKLGGILIGSIIVPSSIADDCWYLFAACHNLDVENDQNWSYIWFDALAADAGDSAVETAIDTSIDKVLEITGELAMAADECEIRELIIEIRPVS